MEKNILRKNTILYEWKNNFLKNECTNNNLILSLQCLLPIWLDIFCQSSVPQGLSRHKCKVNFIVGFIIIPSEEVLDQHSFLSSHYFIPEPGDSRRNWKLWFWRKCICSSCWWQRSSWNMWVYWYIWPCWYSFFLNSANFKMFYVKKSFCVICNHFIIRMRIWII